MVRWLASFNHLRQLDCSRTAVTDGRAFLKRADESAMPPSNAEESNLIAIERESRCHRRTHGERLIPVSTLASCDFEFGILRNRMKAGHSSASFCFCAESRF